MDKREMKQILEVALEKGGDFAEIYLEKKETTMIAYEDRKIDGINTGKDCGIGIRVISGNNTSYAYSNNLEFTHIQEIARTAGKAANSKQQQPVLAFMQQPDVCIEPIVLHPSSISLDEKIDQVRIADTQARELSDAIQQVSVSYSDTVQHVTIANNLGTYVEDERIRTRMTCNAIGQRNNMIQTGFASVAATTGFELLSDDRARNLGWEAGNRVLTLLEAVACPVGEMPVIMASEAGGTMVHEACGHGLEGDLVEKGLSVYANKIEQQVASPLITVIDDATIAHKYGSYRFDDEGHKGEKNVLIENGILKKYMYDQHSAKKAHTQSTGNGRRESYQEKPITRMSNTYIASGNDSVSEMLASTEKGLYVTKMGGGQVNSINGDYVFDVAEGYLIEHGEIKQAVRGATLAGNGPKSLNMVEMLGNDLGYAVGTCGKNGQSAPVSDAQPTMKINGLIVGGTASGNKKKSVVHHIKRV